MNNRNQSKDSKTADKPIKLFGLSIEDKKTPYILFGSVTFLWAVCYPIVRFVACDLAGAGQTGDLFGSINSLFSGLAFAGIIYTILIQREELKAQRHEFVSQKEIFQRQAFETAFFNLLKVNRDMAKLVVGLNAEERNEVSDRSFDLINNRISQWIREKRPREGTSKEEIFEADRSLYIQAIGPSKYTLAQYTTSLLCLLRYIEGSVLDEKDDKEKTNYYKIVGSVMFYGEIGYLSYYIKYGQDGNSDLVRKVTESYEGANLKFVK